MVYGAMCFSGVVLALEILNLASFITHMLAGAGIIGIIAGFALKDVASNAFAGFLLKSQRPFEVGQWVNISQYVEARCRKSGWSPRRCKPLRGRWLMS